MRKIPPPRRSLDRILYLQLAFGIADLLHLLEIEYVSGEVYLYGYVPETEYKQLATAESKGT